ncbi:MAG: TIGR04086 family membrane protein [Clostridia bacterium]|nr:TIGR04086 family membrane protein [Clostridia bacterium]
MQNESVGNGIFQVVKGVGLALGLSFLGAIIFASILTAAPIKSSVIYPVNQTIKVLAVCIGAFSFVREEKGLLKGIAVGVLFTALSYLAFSAIGGDFSLLWLILAEFALAAFAGGVFGAIAVNLRTR